MAAPIDHVVIIVKKPHIRQLLRHLPWRQWRPSEPGTKPAAGPILMHQAWMERAADTANRVQYTEADIPGHFDLARLFTLCDNYLVGP